MSQLIPNPVLKPSGSHRHHPHPCCGIIPPYMLEAMAASEHNTDAVRASARDTLAHMHQLGNLHESGLHDVFGGQSPPPPGGAGGAGAAGTTAGGTGGGGSSTGTGTGTGAGSGGKDAGGSKAAVDATTSSSTTTTGAPPASFIPDSMLSTMAKSELVSPAGQKSAQQTLDLSEQLRAARARLQGEDNMLVPKRDAVSGPPYSTFRSIWSIENTTNLGSPIWLRDANYDTADSQDWVVDQVWIFLGIAITMYGFDWGRDGFDGRGGPIRANIHYGQAFANAFWNGSQLIFGDGNDLIAHLGESMTVVVHEFTHALTQWTSGLQYHDQSGALNESFSDVIGVVAEQQYHNQSFGDATWLVGKECLQPGVNGVAIRSMSAPGTAYDDPRLGKDPQPAHMKDFVGTTSDFGGVHINSGIPNHAFYNACRRVGGNSWQNIGPIWYYTMVNAVKSDCGFAEFARLTVLSAVTGWGRDTATAVSQAWGDVGIIVSVP